MLSLKMIGVKEVIKEIERHKKQLRFAGAVALTKTAVHAKKDIQTGIKESFKSPKPFTVGGVFIKPAKKDDLSAVVGLKDITAKYLSHQVAKQDRAVKGVEKFLHSKGILPKSMFIVPGQAVRLTRAGNISRGMLKKIITGALRPGGEYFFATINSTSGIWKRRGGSVKPMLIFVRKPNYIPQLKFYDIAEKTFHKRFGVEFDKALEMALRTRK